MATDKNIRCHHCAGPLSNEMETSKWTNDPLIRDSVYAIAYSVALGKSSLYGVDRVLPVLQRCIKGPMWLHILIAAPPVGLFTAACAGLGGFGGQVYPPWWNFVCLITGKGGIDIQVVLHGGAAPALAQLVSSSYHAAHHRLLQRMKRFRS